VVADFANLAGDTLLAAAVTEAFRVDVSQSPLVTVLTRRQVNAALTRMQRPIGVTIDDSLACEIAVREGAKAVVTGSIGKIANAYTVSVQLVAVARGEPLAAFRETAADSTALVDAVDRASKQLRHRIGNPARPRRHAGARGGTTVDPGSAEIHRGPSTRRGVVGRKPSSDTWRQRASTRPSRRRICR
jgi:hypothetical protein